MTPHFRKSLWVGMSLVAASIVGFGIFMYWYGGKVGATANEIKTLRGLALTHARTLEEFVALKRDAPNARLYQAQMDAYIPNEDQLLDLPRWLEGFAAVFGIHIDFSFQGGQLEPQGVQPGYTQFSMTLEGEYEKLRAFLRKVELDSEKFVVAIDTLDVVHFAENRFNMRAEGKVFYW